MKTTQGSAVANAGSHDGGGAPKAAGDGNSEMSTDEGEEVSTGISPNLGAKAKAKESIASNDSCMEDTTKEEEPLVLVRANPSWTSPDLQPLYL